jgi:hypothetical protein
MTRSVIPQKPPLHNAAQRLSSTIRETHKTVACLQHAAVLFLIDRKNRPEQPILTSTQ